MQSVKPTLAGLRSKDRVVTQSAAAWGAREESLRRLNGEILRRSFDAELLRMTSVRPDLRSSDPSSLAQTGGLLLRN